VDETFAFDRRALAACRGDFDRYRIALAQAMIHLLHAETMTEAQERATLEHRIADTSAALARRASLPSHRIVRNVDDMWRSAVHEKRGEVLVYNMAKIKLYLTISTFKRINAGRSEIRLNVFPVKFWSDLDRESFDLMLVDPSILDLPLTPEGLEVLNSVAMKNVALARKYMNQDRLFSTIVMDLMIVWFLPELNRLETLRAVRSFYFYPSSSQLSIGYSILHFDTVNTPGDPLAPSPGTIEADTRK
jgi:hypothetical protein